MDILIGIWVGMAIVGVIVLTFLWVEEYRNWIDVTPDDEE